MKKLIIAAQSIFLLAAGCALLPKANIGESRRPDNQEPSQITVPEASEIPAIVVEPRVEPPRPIEYSSLAEQFIPTNKPAEGELVRGYRIQLFSTKNAASADSFVVRAGNSLEVKIYNVYEPPYYKVRAGDFADQVEAVEAEKTMKSKGFETFIVRDIITTGGDY